MTSRKLSNERQQYGRLSYHPSIVVISAAAAILLGNSCCELDVVNGFMSTVPRHRESQFEYNLRLSPGLQQPILPNSDRRNDSKLYLKSLGYNYLVNQWMDARVPPLYSTRNKKTQKVSWSKSVSELDDEGGSDNNGESRFGVRRRVRSVLKKAKKRTGIENSSFKEEDEDSGSTQIKTTLTASNVIADAASIGGLGAVVLDEDSGAVGVALDYVAAPDINGKADFKSANGSRNSTQNEVNGSKVVASPSKINGTSQKTSETNKKTKAASTYSESYKVPSNPEDSIAAVSDSSSSKATSPELDSLRGDLSGAFSLPPPPLPFTLPTLTDEQAELLRNGERVQKQSDMGREGEGFVVLDVNARADAVWDVLLDFDSYPTTIPTVRGIEMYTSTHLSDDLNSETPIPSSEKKGKLAKLKHGIPSITRAAFILSKFRLRIAAIHKYRPHPEGDYMIFTLDPASTNIVLKHAKGIWHTQSNPDGKGEVRIILFLFMTE